jgi:hypothetical protein
MFPFAQISNHQSSSDTGQAGDTGRLIFGRKSISDKNNMTGSHCGTCTLAAPMFMVPANPALLREGNGYIGILPLPLQCRPV